MKILITGGAGFIGSHLVAHHLQKGHTVVIIDNLITGVKRNIEAYLSSPNLVFYQEDIIAFDYSKLSAFDIVYHLASPASPYQYKKHPLETLLTNGYGTYKLLDFVAKTKTKTFVLASTSEVYGDPLVHPQIETYFGNVNPVGVRSCYDEGKRYAEALTATFFRTYGINMRIARIFNTYGENMEKNDGRVVSNFIIQALMNEPITVYGNGTQTRSFCYINDMVRGLSALGSSNEASGEIVNLGNPNEQSVLDLAKTILKLTHSRSDVRFHPIEDDDPKKRKPDITKAQRLLRWNPEIPLEEGLKKTIEYFRKRFI